MGNVGAQPHRASGDQILSSSTHPVDEWMIMENPGTDSALYVTAAAAAGNRKQETCDWVHRTLADDSHWPLTCAENWAVCRVSNRCSSLSRSQSVRSTFQERRAGDGAEEDSPKVFSLISLSSCCFYLQSSALWRQLNLVFHLICEVLSFPDLLSFHPHFIFCI